MRCAHYCLNSPRAHFRICFLINQIYSLPFVQFNAAGKINDMARKRFTVFSAFPGRVAPRRRIYAALNYNPHVLIAGRRKVTKAKFHNERATSGEEFGSLRRQADTS